MDGAPLVVTSLAALAAFAALAWFSWKARRIAEGKEDQ